MTKKAKRILAILMINMFITMVGIGLIVPIMPALMLEFGATGQTVGLLIAAFGFTQFIFSPLAGGLSDKYGRKWLIVIGIGSFAVSQLIFAVGTELWMLYVSRFIEGAAAALIMSPLMAAVADITTLEKRAKGTGLLSAAMSLGFVVGPGIGGFLAEFGLRMPLYVSTATAVVATLVSIFFLPETLSEEARAEAQSKSEKKKESIFKQLANSLKGPYAMLFILVFVMTFGLGNFEAVFGLFVDIQHGFTPKDIAIVITFAALMGVGIQAVVIHQLIGKFGEKKVVSGALLFAAISFILVLMAKSYWVVFGTTLCVFLATSILRPAINTMLSKMAGNEQGMVMGMSNAYISLGNILGPSLAGFLFDVNIFYPYMAASLIMFILFAVMVRTKIEYKQAEETKEVAS
ncbi:MFS transporter [Priestia taiwanensis]|uniref:Tetracycline resistance MFS efflux pump n=1 Tax=Priestia taiwanensis TaxID=1347902 RepID=A0A917AJE3_9BACI|nr:MFS transporter [Priestia taiwanensis]MBM7361839.1 DHA1 family multidrug resistance protein-like MFS transporter [Priestia taiwanensis]GGE57336.1 tetracycline resistance MFS efflux pump [Priestia taiwanensis]